jgi:hypothetical protein
MIFQIPFDLDIQEKVVQAIIDLDTGFIGFTELNGNTSIEYNYIEAPVEFKKAFASKVEILLADKSLRNFKICRKSKEMSAIQSILLENKTAGNKG